MGDPLPLVDTVRAAAAQHGSFCPKMCTFACPVTAATGRDDAVPWSFHRTVSDLAQGRVAPDAALTGRLTACTGCLACREPCLFDQDVPAQVRAGRTALHTAGAAPSAVADAVARVAGGTSPYPDLPIERADRHTSGTPGTPHPGHGSVAVVTGCRDDAVTVHAALRLLRAAGEEPVLVAPSGCCGGVLRDLGAADAADGARRALAAELGEQRQRVVVLDPHCLPETRAAAPDADVVHVVVELHRLHTDGRLQLAPALGPVTYHDPCLLARGEGVVEEPRALLRAAGASVVEPEGHGARTVCSGAGLGLGLLDEPAAEATAAHRRASLGATGTAVVTACAGARQRLGSDALPVADLLPLLADCLPEAAT